MGFSRQEYWSGLPCPPPGDLPDPGITPASPRSPAMAGRFFSTNATREAHRTAYQSSNTPHKFISCSCSLCYKDCPSLTGLADSYQHSKLQSRGLPWWSKVVRIRAFTAVTLVMELRSHKLHNAAKKQKQTNKEKPQSKTNFDECHVSPLKERSGSSCVPFHASTVLWSSIVPVSASPPSNCISYVPWKQEPVHIVDIAHRYRIILTNDSLVITVNMPL